MSVRARDSTMAVLREAKVLAQRYRKLTGRPLGVTGEVAEYEAVRLLKLKIAPVRSPGFDAIETTRHGKRYLQVKGRCLLPGHKPGQRLGSIDTSKKWDAVLLVLLNERLDATAIYEASRRAVLKALARPGSRARNERGQLGVSQFKAIAVQRWPTHAA